MHTSQFLIGAASSGSGKTTFTLGLLRALKNRGLKVQPFKCGPDYLDTKHHAAAAGQTSYNLDTFMASATHVPVSYTHLDVYKRQTMVYPDIGTIYRIPVFNTHHFTADSRLRPYLTNDKQQNACQRTPLFH